MQAEVDTWMSQWEAGYWPPLVNLARLIEEVGELSREINHHHGPKRKKDSEPNTSAADGIADELADILFAVTAIANSEGIDLQASFAKMMRKVVARDAHRWERKTPD